MKIFSKFTNHLRKICKKSKFLVCSAMLTIATAAMSVCASAAETNISGTDTETVMQQAGESLQNSFAAIVKTMIPIMLGILGSAIVIYGIIALVKLGKRIFGHVTG